MPSVYTSLHMPVSDASARPSLPPLPPLSNRKSVLHVVSLLLFHKYVNLCHILDSTCK